ncbi:MAG: hypothetical protein IK004_07055 [Bacteroidales bacterium]|nr:hypothetical protein [Bacteroidales bacterium]
MKHQIIATRDVRKYLYDLIQILYEKDYFGFKENAKEYVKDLFADIEQNLPNKIRKPAPEHFDIYGYNMYYASFKKNKQTTWYVFFTIHYDYDADTQSFLIRYVSNNHVIAKYL